ncbi:hypothetical protein D3C85_1315460 [compost metagenome]
MILARRILEAHMLAHGLGQHLGVVGRVDHPVAPLILFQQRRCKAHVAKATATLPANCLADTALILAVDHLLKPRHDMGMAVFAQLDHDPAAAHFMGHSAGSAGAAEGVENEVAGVGGNSQNFAEQPLWLWSCKCICDINC